LGLTKQTVLIQSGQSSSVRAWLESLNCQYSEDTTQCEKFGHDCYKCKKDYCYTYVQEHFPDNITEIIFVNSECINTTMSEAERSTLQAIALEDLPHLNTTIPEPKSFIAEEEHYEVSSPKDYGIQLQKKRRDKYQY